MIGAFERTKAVKEWGEGKPVQFFKDWEAVLGAARQGKITGVVVENVASVAQTAVQLERIVSELEGLKVAFNLVEEGWSPTARRLLASLAAAQTAMHADRQREALQRKFEREGSYGVGPKKGQAFKLTPEKKAEVYRLADAKKSVADIAEQVELSRPSVYKILKERPKDEQAG